MDKISEHSEDVVIRRYPSADQWHKGLWTPKQRKKRRGWGPYRSVRRERSVEFNLNLDIQNLCQEIERLKTLRGILQQRALITRTSASATPMQIVARYYEMFARGIQLDIRSPSNARRYQQQVAFMHSIRHSDVDFANGLRGIDAWLEMLKRYAAVINYDKFELAQCRIVESDDTIILETLLCMHYRVSSTMIAALFPHILEYPHLVAKLRGAATVGSGTVTFYFDKSNKVLRYEMYPESVDSFARILTDPRDVNVLLGRCLIGKNGVLGVALGCEQLQEAAMTAQPQTLQPADINAVPSLPVVTEYFGLFRHGLQLSNHSDQLAFLQTKMQPYEFMYGPTYGWQALYERWQSLCASFQVLECRLMGTNCKEPSHVPTDWQSPTSRVVHAAVQYDLEITAYTMATVFRHGPATLVGARLCCPAWVEFGCDGGGGRVLWMEETMDFYSALLPVLQYDRAQVEMLMQHALLTKEGMSAH